MSTPRKPMDPLIRAEQALTRLEARTARAHQRLDEIEEQITEPREDQHEHQP